MGDLKSNIWSAFGLRACTGTVSTNMSRVRDATQGHILNGLRSSILSQHVGNCISPRTLRMFALRRYGTHRMMGKVHSAKKIVNARPSS